jgi:hypothetical protein
VAPRHDDEYMDTPRASYSVYVFGAGVVSGGVEGECLGDAVWGCGVSVNLNVPWLMRSLTMCRYLAVLVVFLGIPENAIRG